MYNLLISGNGEAWDGEPYVLERNRVFEHTVDPVREQFQDLNTQQLTRLYSLPSIFAFENYVDRNARIGRIEKIRQMGREVRIEYSFFEQLPELEPEALKRLTWELDISDWELNRTHWAVKDIDLADALLSAGLITKELIEALPVRESSLLRRLPPPEPITVQPTIFRVPERAIEEDLVSVMMPFETPFFDVYEIIKRACADLGLRCLNADEVWQESEIIQDIFSLIYRSRVVVCDFTGKNPNVFYEAGVAHTLGRHVIPLVQKSDDIPFDLQHHRYIEYQNNDEGLANLKSQLTPRLQTLTAQRE